MDHKEDRRIATVSYTFIVRLSINGIAWLVSAICVLRCLLELECPRLYVSRVQLLTLLFDY
jgi:hypothetical protein